MEGSIGSKIKDLRVKKGISQTKLCGNYINRTVLSKIENNKVMPSISQLQYIAQKLQTPASYFINPDSYPEKYNSPQIDSSSLTRMYEDKNYYDIVKLEENMPEAFKALNDFNKYFYLGKSLCVFKRRVEGAKFLNKYIKIYMKSQDAMQKKHIMNFSIALLTLFAISSKYKRSVEKSINYLSTAVKYLIKYDETRSKIYTDICVNLSHLYNESMQFNKTILLLREYFNINSNLVYRISTSYLHLNLYEALLNTNQYDECIKELDRSIPLNTYFEDFDTNACCLLYKADTLRHWGRLHEALHILDNSEDTFVNNKQLYMRFLIGKLKIYFNLGEFDNAKGMLANIYPDIIQNTYKAHKINFYFISGHLYFINHDYTKAIKFLKMCEDYFIEENFIMELMTVYQDLYEMTSEDIYLLKYEKCINKSGKKNIYIK